MNLAKKLQEKLSRNAFFYVTLDPERALGIEDILPNYTIICPYASRLTDELRNRGVSVIILEEKIGVHKANAIIKRGTYGMLRSDFVQSYINKDVGRWTSYIMILKNSALIEELCKKNKWNLLAPKANIAEQFENKISQYNFLKGAVSYPETRIFVLKDLSSGSDPANFTRVGFSRNAKLVLQFNRGHSGNSTFFVKSKKDLERLARRFPKREAKVSKYIKGKAYTLNCLALKSGSIITGSISEQITGRKSATNNPNTTVGNDFTSPRKLSPIMIKSIQKIAKNVGEELHREGYVGLFGIDVIIPLRGIGANQKRGTGLPTDQAGAEVYFIEVNTHQPASVSFEAQLHRKIGKTPLVAYFLLDSADGGVRPSKRDIPPLVLPISAKQIIYRNKTIKTLRAEDIDKKYKNKYLISRMKLIKPNEEMYRKQFNNITI